MTQITIHGMWRNYPFTRDSIRAPSPGYVMPAYDLTENIQIIPSKTRYFSELKIPEGYDRLFGMRYIYMTYEFGNMTLPIYAWIDKVEPISDELPLCRVFISIDYWHSYIDAFVASMGHATVKRRPKLNRATPKQIVPVKYWKHDSSIDLTEPDTNKIYWVIVALVTTHEETENPTYSEFELRCYPVSKTNPSTSVKMQSSTYTYDAVSLTDTIRGRWDEMWGLDPASVSGVWISPMAPVIYSGSGTASDPIVLTEGPWTYWSHTEEHIYGFLKYNGQESVFGPSMIRSGTLSDVTPDDTHKWYFEGLDGEVLGEIPYGMHPQYYTARLVMSTTSCYIQYRLSEEDSNEHITSRYVDSAHGEGLCFTVPCTPLDLSSNAMSSYLYSGQREYDMNARNLESDHALVQGQLDMVNNGLMGVVAGAAVGGPAGIAAGVASAAVTELSLVANYAYEKGIYNKQIQELVDKQKSKQTNGILLSGSGWDWLFDGQIPRLALFVPDDYSLSVWNNYVAEYGYSVDEEVDDAEQFIYTEMQLKGPVMLDNITPKKQDTMNVPPEAWYFIEEKFRRGVKMMFSGNEVIN